MAIDLDMEIRGKFPIDCLVEGTKDVLRKLLGFEPPEIRLNQMVNGERFAPRDNFLSDSDALYFYRSMEGPMRLGLRSCHLRKHANSAYP